MKIKTPTQEIISKLIQANHQVRVEDLRRELNLTRAIIHRHLNQLIKTGQIKKTGKPPLVYYLSAPTETQPTHLPQISANIKKTISQNYLFVSAQGEMVYGYDGFIKWANSTHQLNHLANLAQEYQQTIKQASQLKKENLVNATNKITDTFKINNLKRLYYAEFYSLPKFGKTILGQKVLYAKQSQVVKLIKEISQTIGPLIQKIITKHNIQAIGFIPPTIPRKIQFLKEVEYNLNLNLPIIRLSKAYPADIPVAQKSLSKLSQRIENAQNTIFIKNQNIPYSNILLIDDAVGSGATLNETAAKLLKHSQIKNVFGFAVVGNLKGFDIISEI